MSCLAEVREWNVLSILVLTSYKGPSIVGIGIFVKLEKAPFGLGAEGRVSKGDFGIVDDPREDRVGSRRWWVCERCGGVVIFNIFLHMFGDSAI